MALTKADLLEAVMQASGLTKAQCVDIVDSILSIVKNRLVAGEDVMIFRFVKFQIREKPARRGRSGRSISSNELLQHSCLSEIFKSVQIIRRTHLDRKISRLNILWPI